MTAIPSAQLRMGKELGSPRPGSKQDNWDLFVRWSTKALPSPGQIPSSMCSTHTGVKESRKDPSLEGLQPKNPQSNHFYTSCKSGKDRKTELSENLSKLCRNYPNAADPSRDFLSAEVCSRQAEFSGKNNDEIP